MPAISGCLHFFLKKGEQNAKKIYWLLPAISGCLHYLSCLDVAESLGIKMQVIARYIGLSSQQYLQYCYR